jgi:hypothetical protein
MVMKRAPRAGTKHILRPAGLLDLVSERVTMHDGHQVELTQPYACPKNGRMGMAYVNCLDCNEASGAKPYFIGLVNLASLGRSVTCSTVGCKRQATHTLHYSFPESRDNPVTDVVCRTCGDGYVCRPSLRATLSRGIPAEGESS